VVELNLETFEGENKKESFLNKGQIFSNVIPRDNFYDLSVPYLQQNLTLSDNGNLHKIVKAEVKLGGSSRLLAAEEEEIIEEVEKSGQGLVTFSLIGGCFFFLIQIWNVFILNSLSRHSYYLKMMKHMFYLKMDKKDRDALTFLKKPHEANASGLIKAGDRFAAQNIKIDKIFENKSHNFKEQGEKLP